MNPGKYSASVVQHKLSWSQSGTMGVAVLFQIESDSVERIVMATFSNPECIWHTIWLTEKCANLARKGLKAIGFDIDSQGLEELQENNTLLLGKKCNIEIEEQEYNGKTQMKVKWINSSCDSNINVKEQIKKMNSILRSCEKKPNQEEDISDIPF